LHKECWGSYHALHVADELNLFGVVEDHARLVAVADIVEGFGAVLASEIKEDLLTTAVGLVSRFWDVIWGGVKRCETSEEVELGFPVVFAFLFFSRLFIRFGWAKFGGSG
jgi:hypothetical protein